MPVRCVNKRYSGNNGVCIGHNNGPHTVVLFRITQDFLVIAEYPVSGLRLCIGGRGICFVRKSHKAVVGWGLSLSSDRGKPMPFSFLNIKNTA